jgi:hypothetical protein
MKKKRRISRLFLKNSRRVLERPPESIGADYFFFLPAAALGFLALGLDWPPLAGLAVFGLRAEAGGAAYRRTKGRRILTVSGETG